MFNSNNIFAFTPIKKPVLTEAHKKERFNFAKKILFMETEKIEQLVSTDKSKFNLLYSDRKVSVCRTSSQGYDDKCLNLTKKFGGGSVMVWGCMTHKRVGRLRFIEGKMDSAMFVSILFDSLISSVQELDCNNFILQQDNDPKHTSKLTKGFLRDKSIRTLDSPSQSPDLNPIENLWGYIKQKIAENQLKNKTELK